MRFTCPYLEPSFFLSFFGYVFGEQEAGKLKGMGVDLLGLENKYDQNVLYKIKSKFKNPNSREDE